MSVVSLVSEEKDDVESVVGCINTVFEGSEDRYDSEQVKKLKEDIIRRYTSIPIKQLCAFILMLHDQVRPYVKGESSLHQLRFIDMPAKAGFYRSVFMGDDVSQRGYLTPVRRDVALGVAGIEPVNPTV